MKKYANADVSFGTGMHTEYAEYCINNPDKVHANDLSRARRLMRLKDMETEKSETAKAKERAKYSLKNRTAELVKTVTRMAKELKNIHGDELIKLAEARTYIESQLPVSYQTAKSYAKLIMYNYDAFGVRIYSMASKN